jgi:hypothetical protein
MNEQEQYWYDHVTKQQASDQSITGYCKERNISRSTFAKMRDRLDLGQPKNEVRRSGFISIVEDKNDNDLVLVLSSGVEIKFNHTPDHLWLSKLIVELG